MVALAPAGSPPADLVARLAKIEGQVRGISRMIEEKRWCPDVLRQIGAVEAALSRVKERLLESHLDHCVRRVLDSGSAEEKRAAVAEVLEAVKRTRER